MISAKEVKEQLRIVDVVKYYGINVNRKNKAICPFHDDKHASLSFKRGMFTCFTCGEHGDVIDFVMKYFNLNFREALLKLDTDFQLGLSTLKLSDSEREKIKRQNHIRDVRECRKQENNSEIKQLEQRYRILFDAYCKGNKQLKPYLDDLDKEIDWRIEQNE